MEFGYDSEPAISRAFRRVVGVPPSVVRRGTASAADAPHDARRTAIASEEGGAP